MADINAQNQALDNAPTEAIIEDHVEYKSADEFNMKKGRLEHPLNTKKTLFIEKIAENEKYNTTKFSSHKGET